MAYDFSISLETAESIKKGITSVQYIPSIFKSEQ